jgi:hypothetical protein
MLVVYYTMQDPATTLFAVRGAGDFYSLHSSGHNLVNATTGANEWTEEGQGWHQSYLIQKSPTDAVRNAINELMLDPPRKHTRQV